MARAVTPTDRAIIRLLQENARISYAELSRATGIPESTVRRRMERLQQRGIIEFAMLAEIAEMLRSMNEVTFAAFLTGSFDVMVQVVVQSQEALVEFLTQRVARIEGVRSTETFVMPWVIKPVTSWILPDFQEPDIASDDNDDLNDELADIDDVVPIRRKRGRPRKLVAAR